MIQVKTFIFNPFQENTIVIYDDVSKESIIIDPGCYDDNEQKGLLTYVQEQKLIITRLINTHCHIDHILGNGFVKKEFKVNIEAHKLDESLLNNAVDHGAAFGIILETPPEIDMYLEENDIIKITDSEIKVIHVPGHSQGSIVLYSEKGKFVIAGDVLFDGSIGRTDLPGGDYDTLINQIKTKLLVLDDDVVVYSGHGVNTTIGKERKTNPFLQ